MNKILIETHKKENIRLLKARDYLFDRARKLNRLKRVFVFLPALILALSYLPVLTQYDFFDRYRDVYSGTISVACYFITFFMARKIDSLAGASNVFREQYDVNVFGMKRNDYLYDYGIINEKIALAEKKISDDGNYECWYDEIFADDHGTNVLCCQMDNVVYTYYAYERTRKLYVLLAGAGLVAYVSFCVAFCLLSFVNVVVLSALALFGVFQIFFEFFNTSSELIKRNGDIIGMVCTKKITPTDDELRCIQDVIAENRDKALFIPLVIRKWYLRNKSEKNAYFKKLSQVKRICMDSSKNVSMPSSSSDIEILSPDGKEKTTLSTIQARLVGMLKDIVAVLDENEIAYSLDGGTLISAIRENGKMLFWDDDIDIAVKYADLNKIYELLKTKLSDKYDLQNYENEPFYSPRLSNLRVREKNTASVTDEKDSPLFEKYAMRGLFIDIYAYCPIIKNVRFDFLYKKLFFLPLHKSLKRIELKWMGNHEKYEKLFKKKKAKYMKRLDVYHKRAKCSDYYSYTPNYFGDMRKLNPYYSEKDLYGKERMAPFAGLMCKVPTNAEAVLEATYGTTWNKSPYIPLEELIKMGDGAKTFYATSMKHIAYIRLLDSIDNLENKTK